MHPPTRAVVVSIEEGEESAYGEDVSILVELHFSLSSLN